MLLHSRDYRSYCLYLKAVSEANAAELSLEDLLVAELQGHTRETLADAAVEYVQVDEGADSNEEKSVKSCWAWLLLS